MELYIYETPNGHVADFRPYLDGFDHSFEEPRPLAEDDARWEKVNSIFHPETGSELGGKLRCVGTAEVEWKELMRFPIVWTGDVGASDAAEANASS